jgi:hypothetical protein
LRIICPPTKYGESTYTATSYGHWLWDFFNDIVTGQYDEIYRYRSKIESIFSALKRTMGWHLRMRLTKAEKLALALDQAPEAGGVDNDSKPKTKRRKITADAIGIGRENELLARLIIWNLRVLVILEKLHDQRINFALDTKFRPIAADRLTGYHPLSGQAPDLPEAA